MTLMRIRDMVKKFRSLVLPVMITVRFNEGSLVGSRYTPPAFSNTRRNRSNTTGEGGGGGMNV